MPRFDRRTLALAVFVLGAAAAILYVIPASRVHEGPPKALSALVFDPSPRPLAPVTVTGATGKPVALSAFRGRMVVLNVWAAWCAPCVKELPALGRLAASIPGARLSVVAVNAGRDTLHETVVFLKAHGAGDLVPYRDPHLNLLAAFGAQGLPFSVLIDSRGREIARALGPVRWDDPAAIAYLTKLASSRAQPDG